MEPWRPTSVTQGLSSAEAQRRLARLGEPEPPNSRSVASIVTANVLTLFNAIIGVFFILILSLGLWADALFGLIAIVNSGIGIRQELKAKETLDRLALLVAPRAKVIRDGRLAEVTADEVVPGDIVRVEPGDQLVADGPLVDTRGLTVDESLLTGESDGIRKRIGDRMLSGSFGLSGSGHYEVDAVREHSYAEKVAGEAREFRHAPSPLQVEVNMVLRATTIALVPIALIVLAGFTIHDKEFRDAAQEATAGLVTLIPEGLVLLMSVTLALAAVRLARQNTLVQQMAATEALAAVDTICVDKTGTLTDGTLKLVAVEVARRRPRARRRARARHLRRLGRRAQPDPGDDRRALPGPPRASRPPRCRSPRSGSGAGRPLTGRSYVIGAPDVLTRAGALNLSEGHAPPARRAHAGRPPGDRLWRGTRRAALRPGPRAPGLAGLGQARHLHQVAGLRRVRVLVGAPRLLREPPCQRLVAAVAGAVAACALQPVEPGWQPMRMWK